MKNFDLGKALAGYPVCTRDGHKARIICFDAKGAYPVVALVDGGDDGEGPVSYMTNGQVRSGLETEFDLFMVPKKYEGWINIYRDGDSTLSGTEIFQNKAEAMSKIVEEGSYIATVKVEWEE